VVSGALPAPASEVVGDLLARLDRALPGRVEGLYVVGSAAMGAFRPGRSDVDFVAIVDRNLSRAELVRLRALHIGRWTSALVRDTARRRR
jgi:predicted nucleotidyltransferase